jgi:malate dehydrogenase (oxaloacetate-decarboxylating)
MQDLVRTPLSGLDLIRNPLLNKGTAFTDAERTAFALHGLLPPHIGTLDEQVARRLKALRALSAGFQQYSFLRDLQDSNETLFYALLTRNIEEIMPLVYTPTVGEGCQRFSEIWRKPRGLFLSYPNRHRIREILAHPRYDQVRVIVVSDGERILGLGDQGAGGMGIPIGKLALYTACGGIRPEFTLPVLLDVGTDNAERRANPIYIGWNHERVRGAQYDDFVESFVEAVCERWPMVLLQWEDFAGSNAGRLLQRYRDRLCTFNDDIQGTAAVAVGTLLSAISVTGIPLTQQRIALLGAGSAGGGIASLLIAAMVESGLTEHEARSRFYAVGLDGLLLDDAPDLVEPQRRLALPRAAIAGWKLRRPGAIDMLDVIENAKPTALIGVTGQPGVFTEEMVRAMAKVAERPMIFPLSNPTSRSEADPADIMRWTDGRALIGTGSPYPPVERNGKRIPVDQCNNSYIFPGVGLGVLAAQARRVTDSMFMAAAKALAEMSPARQDHEARLLPPLTDIRAVSISVATAVAKQACREQLAEGCEEATLGGRILAEVWEPVYRPYVPAGEPLGA